MDMCQQASGSQFSGDELALAVYRVLGTDKSADEVGRVRWRLLMCLTEYMWGADRGRSV